MSRLNFPNGRLRFRAALATVAIGQLMTLGCAQKPERPALATYPAAGKVVTTGTLPVGGCVQLMPMQNSAEYVAQGVVDENGRFSLKVPFVDRVLPGATEGPHSARVLLPLNQGGTIVPIEGSYTVGRGDNEFTIKMPSPPAR